MTEQTSVSTTTTWEIIILQILLRNSEIPEEEKRNICIKRHRYRPGLLLLEFLVQVFFFQVKNPAPGVTYIYIYISDLLISFWHLYFTILIVALLFSI